jgi:hypothetical protein
MFQAEDLTVIAELRCILHAASCMQTLWFCTGFPRPAVNRC